MKNAILKLQGMSCASCAHTIEKTIQAVEGVHKATVSFAADQATVVFDSQTTNLQIIQEAVGKAGYGAAPLNDWMVMSQDGETIAQQARSRDLRCRVVVEAVCSVLLIIGTGTNVAITASDITLISGDLHGIVTAIQLSRATIRNIRQNLFFAFIYNIIGIPIVAGILFPFFGWLLNPIIAEGAMALSSISVFTNALRLKNSQIHFSR